MQTLELFLMESLLKDESIMIQIIPMDATRSVTSISTGMTQNHL